MIAITSSMWIRLPAEKTKNPKSQPIISIIAIRYNMASDLIVRKFHVLYLSKGRYNARLLTDGLLQVFDQIFRIFHPNAQADQ